MGVLEVLRCPFQLPVELLAVGEIVEEPFHPTLSTVNQIPLDIDSPGGLQELRPKKIKPSVQREKLELILVTFVPVLDIGILDTECD